MTAELAALGTYHGIAFRPCDSADGGWIRALRRRLLQIRVTGGAQSGPARPPLRGLRLLCTLSLTRNSLARNRRRRTTGTSRLKSATGRGATGTSRLKGAPALQRILDLLRVGQQVTGQ